MTIHFLRHGQTICSRDNVFCGSGLDPALTDEGQQMARSFAEAYRATPWNAIYTSPQTRALSTAQPLCEMRGTKPEIRDGLREISYGQWEGKTAAAVSQEFHDDYLQWTADPGWHAPTGGEPAVAIARRGLAVIEEIKHLHSGNVLIVSHKATIRILLCSLLGIDVGRFRYRLGCPVGSVSRIEFGLQGPLLHTLADRTHLAEALRSLPGT